MRWLSGLLLAAAATLPWQLNFTADGTGAAQRKIAAKLGDEISVKDFGATGDGTTDDTVAIQAAITAGAGKTIYFPRPATSYKVTDNITVSTANTRLFGDGSKIYMAFTSTAPSNGRLFYVTASGVEFDNLWIDSTGTSATTTGNKYAIQFAGTNGTHLTNIRVHDCQFTSLPWTLYPPSGVGTPYGTHAIYAQYVDGITVRNNRVDTVGGAAVFLSVVTKANILDNDIANTSWYSINLNDGVDGALVRGNRITGTLTQGRLWGGSVNVMSNSVTGAALGCGNARIKHVEIAGNYISGTHSYSGAVHIESASYISFHHNILEAVTLTFPSDFYSAGTPPGYVRIYVRPCAAANTNEGANDHIDVSDNVLISGGPSDQGIYADAQDNGSGTLVYSDTLTVRNNRLTSLDSTHYFGKGVIVHGQQGGWKNVAITKNAISGFTDVVTPVTGMIGIIGLAAAPVLDVQAEGNTLTVIGGAPTSATLGLSIDAYTQRALVQGNIVTGYNTGLRTFANSSSVYFGSGNSFSGSTNTDLTLGVAPSPLIGTAAVYGSLIGTPRGTDLTATTVVSLAAAGEYRVCAVARTTTSGSGTTSTLNIIWTDEGGAKTDAVGTWALNSVTVTGQINKCEFIHAAASTNIQVSTSGGTYGTSLYSISAIAEKLN